MSFRREHLGTIDVHSGKLVVLDPEQLNGLNGRTALKPTDLASQAKAATLTDESGAVICDDRAAAFDAQVQTAEVFANYNERGVITSIEIRLEEE
ncbi:MAG: hypothetical protein M0000_07320 [Actinomycetota bacterium]|nr:hypothetical protein [Actinomycetota bacterium]